MKISWLLGRETRGHSIIEDGGSNAVVRSSVAQRDLSVEPEIGRNRSPCRAKYMKTLILDFQWIQERLPSRQSGCHSIIEDGSLNAVVRSSVAQRDLSVVPEIGRNRSPCCTKYMKPLILDFRRIPTWLLCPETRGHSIIEDGGSNAVVRSSVAQRDLSVEPEIGRHRSPCCAKYMKTLILDFQWIQVRLPSRQSGCHSIIEDGGSNAVVPSCVAQRDLSVEPEMGRNRSPCSAKQMKNLILDFQWIQLRLPSPETRGHAIIEDGGLNAVVRSSVAQRDLSIEPEIGRNRSPCCAKYMKTLILDFPRTPTWLLCPETRGHSIIEDGGSNAVVRSSVAQRDLSVEPEIGRNRSPCCAKYMKNLILDFQWIQVRLPSPETRGHSIIEDGGLNAVVRSSVAQRDLSVEPEIGRNRSPCCTKYMKTLILDFQWIQVRLPSPETRGHSIIEDGGWNAVVRSSVAQRDLSIEPEIGRNRSPCCAKYMKTLILDFPRTPTWLLCPETRGHSIIEDGGSNAVVPSCVAQRDLSVEPEMGRNRSPCSAKQTKNLILDFQWIQVRLPSPETRGHSIIEDGGLNAVVRSSVAQRDLSVEPEIGRNRSPCCAKYMKTLILDFQWIQVRLLISGDQRSFYNRGRRFECRCPQLCSSKGSLSRTRNRSK